MLAFTAFLLLGATAVSAIGPSPTAQSFHCPSEDEFGSALCYENDSYETTAFECVYSPTVFADDCPSRDQTTGLFTCVYNKSTGTMITAESTNSYTGSSGGEYCPDAVSGMPARKGRRDALSSRQATGPAPGSPVICHKCKSDKQKLKARMDRLSNIRKRSPGAVEVTREHIQRAFGASKWDRKEVA